VVLWLAYQEEKHMDPACTADARDGMASVSGVLVEFGEWLDRQRGLAPITIDNYCWNVEQFLGAWPQPMHVSVSLLDAGNRHCVHGRALPGSQYELGEVDGEVGAFVPAVRACDGSNIGRVVGRGSGVRRLAFGVATEVGAGSRP
jgi:hypothetical protein